MRSLLSRRPSPALIVAMLALVVATSGVAVAATIGNDKVVYACVNADSLREHGESLLGTNSDGVVVVTDPAGCATAVDGGWAADALPLNAPGPQGPQGAPGPQGLVGAGGPGGPQGPAGQVAPVPAAPKLSPAEVQKLTGSISKTEDKLDQNQRKIADALKKLEKAKAGGASQAEIEKMMQAINAMIAALLSSQQTQQNALGSLSQGVGIGMAQQKLKDAEKAKEAVEGAARKYQEVDAAKERQRALDEMIKGIIEMISKMQQAQGEQMKVIVRL